MVALSGCYTPAKVELAKLAFWAKQSIQSTEGAKAGNVGPAVNPPESPRAAVRPRHQYVCRNQSRHCLAAVGQTGAPTNTAIPRTPAIPHPSSGYPSTQYPSTGTTPGGSSETPYTASTAGVPGAGAWEAHIKHPSNTAGTRGLQRTGTSSGSYPPAGATSPNSYTPSNYAPSGGVIHRAAIHRAAIHRAAYAEQRGSNDLPANPVRSNPRILSPIQPIGSGTTDSGTGAPGYVRRARYDTPAGGSSYDRPALRPSAGSGYRDTTRALRSAGTNSTPGSYSPSGGSYTPSTEAVTVRQAPRCPPRQRWLRTAVFRLHADKHGRERSSYSAPTGTSLSSSGANRYSPSGAGTSDPRPIGLAAPASIARKAPRLNAFYYAQSKPPASLRPAMRHDHSSYTPSTGSSYYAVNRQQYTPSANNYAVDGQWHGASQQLHAIDRKQLHAPDSSYRRRPAVLACRLCGKTWHNVLLRRGLLSASLGWDQNKTIIPAGCREARG